MKTDEQEEERNCKKQKIIQDSEIFVDKVKSTTHGTKSYDECDTSTSKSCNPIAKISSIGIWRRKNGRYAAVITDRIRHKRLWLGIFDTVEEASHAYFSKKSEFEKLSQQGNKENKSPKNFDQIQQPESSAVICRRNKRIDSQGKEPDSSKAKISLIGIRRRKNGRYSARITDPIKHKRVYLGVFDTIEEASQAYLSKKCEFEELRQRGNKENKSKKNCDQIQEPESSSVVASLDVASSARRRDKIIESRAYQSKKLEFQKLVKAKQHQRTTNKHAHSKQDAREEKLVNVKRGYDERFQPESAYQSKGKQEFSCLMANARSKESSDECNITTSWNSTAKRSFVGIKRQTNGRYAAVITDRVKQRKMWFGTFDTIEEASQAYLSKKSEFEKLRHWGNKENKSKKDCDQIQQPESSSVVASLDTASASGRDKRIDSHKRTTHIVGAHWRKTTGKYTSEITNPITKKKIWLGSFGTAEEASQAYQSKKLEFQKLVKAKQHQLTTNKHAHSKQDRRSEKLVNAQREHENVNCQEINVPISNSLSGGTDLWINSHKIGAAEESFHTFLSKKFDSKSSKEVEVQNNTPADSSAGEKQDDQDLWMGKWVQLPGDRAVMFSLKLGLPIIDNYGSLLGEFSSLDDLSIS